MDSQGKGPRLPDDEPEHEAAFKQAGRDQGHDTSPSIPIFTSVGEQSRQALGSMTAPPVKNLAAAFAPTRTASWFPHIEITNLLLLQLQTSVFDVVRGFSDDILKQQMSITIDLGQALFKQYYERWDALFASLRTLAEKLLPPNWKGAKLPDAVTIETIMLDEGIPLAWIPCRETVQAVLDASDAAKRRQVTGRRWQRTVSDCEVALSEVRHTALRCHQPFAAKIVRALRDGHSSAAQALAANLLDSILRHNFDKDEFKTVTTNRKGGSPFDLDDYQIKAAFTLASINKRPAWLDSVRP